MKATVQLTDTHVKLNVDDPRGFCGTIEAPIGCRHADGGVLMRDLGLIRDGQEIEITLKPVANDRE